MNTENKKNNRKKKAAGVSALVLALLLLLGGTFAWYTMASALNEFENEPQGAVLHDDFLEAKSGDVESNKDVYVENTGDEELFIRVKLTEYFEINGTSQGDAAADKDDMDTWDVHTGTTSASEDAFHEYWQWKTGGASIQYEKAPLFKTGTMKRYDENGVDTITSEPTKLGMTNGGNPSTVITLAAYDSMTSAEQSALEACWILDSTDGYAYWSEKLTGGETTGLLLDSVTRIKDPDGRYYYGINVEMQSVDEADLLAWLNGTTTLDGKATPDQASAKAQALLKNLSNQYVHHSTLTPEFGEDPETYADGDGYLGKDEQEAFETAKLAAVKAAVAAQNVGEKVTIAGADFIVASKSGTQVELLLAEPTNRMAFSTGGGTAWASSDIKAKVNAQTYIDDNIPAVLQSILVEKANTPSDISDKDKMYLMSKTTADALLLADASVMQADFDWWLMTPVDGTSTTRLYYVDGSDGSIDTDGIAATNAQKAVRPVFTVDTN